MNGKNLFLNIVEKVNLKKSNRQREVAPKTNASKKGVFQRSLSWLVQYRLMLYLPGIMLLHNIACVFAFNVGLLRLSLPELLGLVALSWSGHFAIVAIAFSKYSARFSSIHLTLFQMMWTTGVIIMTTYFVDQIRFGLLMLFLATMMVGSFKVRLPGFTVVAATGAGGYILTLCLLAFFRPESILVSSILVQEIIQITVLLAVTFIFALLGADISALQRKLSLRNKKLTAALDHIQELAIRDELTGLYNRRYMLDMLSQYKELAGRGGVSFTVCYLDLDFFKSINDRFGHGSGDQVLKDVSRLLGDQIRTIDFAGRFGGEEFVLLLVNTDMQTALAVAERVREKVSLHNFDYLV